MPNSVERSCFLKYLKLSSIILTSPIEFLSKNKSCIIFRKYFYHKPLITGFKKSLIHMYCIENLHRKPASEWSLIPLRTKDCSQLQVTSLLTKTQAQGTCRNPSQTHPHKLRDFLQGRLSSPHLIHCHPHCLVHPPQTGPPPRPPSPMLLGNSKYLIVYISCPTGITPDIYLYQCSLEFICHLLLSHLVFIFLTNFSDYTLHDYS